MMRAGGRPPGIRAVHRGGVPGIVVFDAERGEGPAPGAHALLANADEHRSDARPCSAPMWPAARRRRCRPRCCNRLSSWRPAGRRVPAPRGSPPGPGRPVAGRRRRCAGARRLPDQARPARSSARRSPTASCRAAPARIIWRGPSSAARSSPRPNPASRQAPTQLVSRPAPGAGGSTVMHPRGREPAPGRAPFRRPHPPPRRCGHAAGRTRPWSG